jgi:putative transposase
VRFEERTIRFEERTIHGYGVMIDHVYYWDDALRPSMHARDPEDAERPRRFVFRINPRNMREIYFWNPSEKTYIPIAYRDRCRPPTSRWEIQAAEKLKRSGLRPCGRGLIFEAIQEMRTVEQESAIKTTKARRAKEMRDNPPLHPSTTPAQPSSAEPNSGIATIPGTDHFADSVEPFEGIVEPD